MSIFRTHRSQSDRSAADRTRHREKLEKAIRGGITDIIAEESIIGQDGSKKIKIPVRGIKEYQFIYGDNTKQVGSAPGHDVQRGQKIGESQPGKQPGNKAGQDKGEEIYEIEVTLAEIIQYMFDSLKLPNMAKKRLGQMSADRLKRSGYRKQGIRARLDKKETMIARLKRKNSSIRAGKIEPDSDERFPFHENDMTYRHIIHKQKDCNNAVIFFVMDVSGSMDQKKKFLARSFFFLLYQFIKTKYENTDVVFVAHATEAHECDEKQFFTYSPNGGTFISPSMVMVKNIIDDRYDPSEWNIYTFYCGDGDNWDSDNQHILPAFRSVWEVCQMMAYIEICPTQPMAWAKQDIVSGNLLPLVGDRFKILKITSSEEVWPSLTKLFGREISALTDDGDI